MTGRSKACANCKLRRIKCDESRPTCQRCRKAGLQCPGYARQTKFVDETHWVRRKHESFLSSPSSLVYYDSDPASKPSPPLRRDGVGISIAKELHQQQQQQQQQQRARIPFHSTSTIQRKLDPSVVEFLRGVFVTREIDFTSWYYSSHHHDHYQHHQHHNQPLIHNGHSESSSWTMSKRAFLPGITLQAVALGLHGQKTQSHKSLIQAAELYGFAVRHLRLDLMDNNKNTGFVMIHNQRDMVLSLMDSMLNLCMYEMIQKSNNSARNYHIQALATLIEMQGPHAFKQGLAKALFLKARSYIVVMALECDQKTFLSQEKWQTIPWSTKDVTAAGRKGFINRFLDILLCISSLLPDSEYLRSSTTSSSTSTVATEERRQEEPDRKRLVASIRAQLTSLNERLFDIRLDWEILKPRAGHEVFIDDSNTNKPDNSSYRHNPLSVDNQGKPLFDSVIYYQDLQSCVEMGLYYSCLCLLRNMAQCIGMDTTTMPFSSLSSTSSFMAPRLNLSIQNKKNEGLKLPNEIRTARDAGREICRSVEYFLQPCHGITGAYFCILPLRLAQFTFIAKEEDQRLARWTRGVMRYIGDEYGLHNAYAFG